MPSKLNFTDSNFISFREALAGHESSGSYSSVNPFGFLGR